MFKLHLKIDWTVAIKCLIMYDLLQIDPNSEEEN